MCGVMWSSPLNIGALRPGRGVTPVYEGLLAWSRRRSWTVSLAETATLGSPSCRGLRHPWESFWRGRKGAETKKTGVESKRKRKEGSDKKILGDSWFRNFENRVSPMSLLKKIFQVFSHKTPASDPFSYPTPILARTVTGPRTRSYTSLVPETLFDPILGQIPPLWCVEPLL